MWKKQDTFLEEALFLLSTMTTYLSKAVYMRMESCALQQSLEVFSSCYVITDMWYVLKEKRSV